MSEIVTIAGQVDLLCSQQPRQAVVVIIERRDGSLLFIRRPDHDSYPGYWNNVTGACEVDDLSLEATCVREAKEEVGLDVRVVGKVWESTTSRASFVLHWFLARAADEGQPVLACAEEVSDWKWLRLAEVQALDLAFADTREFFANQFSLTRGLLLAAHARLPR